MSESPEELARRVGSTAMRAMFLLDERTPNCEAAFALLLPFEHLEQIEGTSERQSNAAMHLYCSAMADTYRASGDPASAVEWYSRVSDYSPFGGYARFYADLVIEHEYEEHYEHALHCLRVCERPFTWWKPLVTLIGLIVWCVLMVRRPWNMKPCWELKKRSRNFERILSERISRRISSRRPPRSKSS